MQKTVQTLFLAWICLIFTNCYGLRVEESKKLSEQSQRFSENSEKTGSYVAENLDSYKNIKTKIIGKDDSSFSKNGKTNKSFARMSKIDSLKTKLKIHKQNLKSKDTFNKNPPKINVPDNMKYSIKKYIINKPKTKLSKKTLKRKLSKSHQTRSKNRELSKTHQTRSKRNIHKEIKYSEPKKTNYFHQNPITGSYEYGYRLADQYKEETRTADGVVRGSYGWKDDHGTWHRTAYVADEYGYRILSPEEENEFVGPPLTIPYLPPIPLYKSVPVPSNPVTQQTSNINIESNSGQKFAPNVAASDLFGADEIEEVKPENTKPENTESGNTKPENTDSENTKPENAKPENTESENTKPDKEKVSTDDESDSDGNEDDTEKDENVNEEEDELKFTGDFGNPFLSYLFNEMKPNKDDSKGVNYAQKLDGKTPITKNPSEFLSRPFGSPNKKVQNEETVTATDLQDTFFNNFPFQSKSPSFQNLNKPPGLTNIFPGELKRNPWPSTVQRVQKPLGNQFNPSSFARRSGKIDIPSSNYYSKDQQNNIGKSILDKTEDIKDSWPIASQNNTIDKKLKKFIQAIKKLDFVEDTQLDENNNSVLPINNKPNLWRDVLIVYLNKTNKSEITTDNFMKRSSDNILTSNSPRKRYRLDDQLHTDFGMDENIEANTDNSHQENALTKFLGNFDSVTPAVIKPESLPLFFNSKYPTYPSYPTYSSYPTYPSFHGNSPFKHHKYSHNKYFGHNKHQPFDILRNSMVQHPGHYNPQQFDILKNSMVQPSGDQQLYPFYVLEKHYVPVYSIRPIMLPISPAVNPVGPLSPTNIQPLYLNPQWIQDNIDFILMNKEFEMINGSIANHPDFLNIKDYLNMQNIKYKLGDPLYREPVIVKLDTKENSENELEKIGSKISETTGKIKQLKNILNGQIGSSHTNDIHKLGITKSNGKTSGILYDFTDSFAKTSDNSKKDFIGQFQKPLNLNNDFIGSFDKTSVKLKDFTGSFAKPLVNLNKKILGQFHNPLINLYNDFTGSFDKTLVNLKDFTGSFGKTSGNLKKDFISQFQKPLLNLNNDFTGSDRVGSTQVNLRPQFRVKKEIGNTDDMKLFHDNVDKNNQNSKSRTKGKRLNKLKKVDKSSHSQINMEKNVIENTSHVGNINKMKNIEENIQNTENKRMNAENPLIENKTKSSNNKLNNIETTENRRINPEKPLIKNKTDNVNKKVMNIENIEIPENKIINPEKTILIENETDNVNKKVMNIEDIENTENRRINSDIFFIENKPDKSDSLYRLNDMSPHDRRVTYEERSPHEGRVTNEERSPHEGRVTDEDKTPHEGRVNDEERFLISSDGTKLNIKGILKFNGQLNFPPTNSKEIIGQNVKETRMKRLILT